MIRSFSTRASSNLEVHLALGIDPSCHIHMQLSQLVGYISKAASSGDIERRFDPDETSVKMDGELGMLLTSGRTSNTES